MIVNHVSRLLGERRMSVRDLERATGVNYNTLYLWYAGRVGRFDATVLERICAALHVGVGDVLEYRPGAEATGDAEPQELERAA